MPESPLEFVKDLPDDLSQLTVVDEIGLMGQFVWDLASRSVARLVIIFLSVLVVSLVPAVLFLTLITLESQVLTRFG